MKSKTSTRSIRQQDFWPELKSLSMAFYAGATPTAASTPARSPVGEDSRRSSQAGVPLGIYGENGVTSAMESKPLKDNSERLAWFSHPSRAVMLNEPAWKTVFRHLVIACKGHSDD